MCVFVKARTILYARLDAKHTINDYNYISIGIKRIKIWIKKSLCTRLQKSLSFDWIRPERAYTFPLQKYYVQLEWQKKKRTVFGIEREKLTSLTEVIEQINGANRSLMNSADVRPPKITTVLIEGLFSIN